MPSRVDTRARYGSGHVKTGVRRVRRIRDNLSEINSVPIRRLARIGGIKSVRKNIYPTVQQTVKHQLTKIIKNVAETAEKQGQKSVESVDIVYAIGKVDSFLPFTLLPGNYLLENVSMCDESDGTQPSAPSLPEIQPNPTGNVLKTADEIQHIQAQDEIEFDAAMNIESGLPPTSKMSFLAVESNHNHNDSEYECVLRSEHISNVADDNNLKNQLLRNPEADLSTTVRNQSIQDWLNDIVDETTVNAAPIATDTNTKSATNHPVSSMVTSFRFKVSKPGSGAKNTK